MSKWLSDCKSNKRRQAAAGLGGKAALANSSSMITPMIDIGTVIPSLADLRTCVWEGRGGAGEGDSNKKREGKVVSGSAGFLGLGSL